MPPSSSVIRSIEEVSIREEEDSSSKAEHPVKGVLYNDQASSYTLTTQVARVFVVITTILSIIFSSTIQFHVDTLWEYLRNNHVFCSAYFETVYVTAVYGLIIAGYPFAMHYMPFLQRFKVTNDVTYVHQSMIGILMRAVVYMAPLLAADAIIIKRYWGVPESEWMERRQQWIQTTRALPSEAPPFLTMCASVLGSVVVFDILFFAVHYVLHKSRFLYKHIHAVHHDHDNMHPHVTDQLSVIERLLLIASANYALKLFRCHPLTRVAFVPVFLWLLIENHTGYDLPWAPHRLMPQGVMGGPAKHHAHHLNCKRYYQPFFNYLDDWLERKNSKKKKT